MSISVSPFNPIQQSGCRAKNPPDLVIASRAPGVHDYGFFLGTVWLYEGNSAWILGSTIISPTTKSASWLELSAGTSTVSSVTGTANQITASPTSGAVVLTIPSTFIAPGSIKATVGPITATNGNLVLGTAGNKILSTSVGTTTAAGANSFGSVTLVGGTATVATSAVTSSSLIYLSRQSIGSTGAAALGQLSVGTIVGGTSFVINAALTATATSLATTDVSVVSYMIVN